MAHVLVVDDDAIVRDLIADVLTGHSHTCEAVESGADALARIGAARFDLVILDRNMPHMSGIQVLKTLRANPATAGLKVIMCTAAELLAEVDEAFQAGAVDYLVKPLDIGKLLVKITHHTRPASV